MLNLAAITKKEQEWVGEQVTKIRNLWVLNTLIWRFRYPTILLEKKYLVLWVLKYNLIISYPLTKIVLYYPRLRVIKYIFKILTPSTYMYFSTLVLKYFFKKLALTYPKELGLEKPTKSISFQKINYNKILELGSEQFFWESMLMIEQINWIGSANDSPSH